MKELTLKKKKNTLKYIFKRCYAMTNKEFIDYMYICGKLKDVKFDTNMEVFVIVTEMCGNIGYLQRVYWHLIMLFYIQ